MMLAETNALVNEIKNQLPESFWAAAGSTTFGSLLLQYFDIGNCLID